MQPTLPAVKINQYKTNVGTFFKIEGLYSQIGYKVNAVDISELALINGYRKINADISTVSKIVSTPAKVISYKLKDTSVQCEALPAETTNFAWDEEDIELLINGRGGLAGLYEPVLSERETYDEPVNFELCTLGEYIINNPENIAQRKIKYLTGGNHGSGKVQEVDLSSVVVYDDITKILTPEFCLNQAPCKLTSKQMYDIIRQHIKENLDYKENSITSDYDFCFTVKKRVHTKPFVSTESYYSGNKLKSKKVTKQEKLVEVFEMTYSGYRGSGGYEGYSCIKELHGDNLEDLYDKLTAMLDGIITSLNLRVQECECCGGTGCIIQKVQH
jgi:hypothetical protein